MAGTFDDIMILLGICFAGALLFITTFTVYSTCYGLYIHSRNSVTWAGREGVTYARAIREKHSARLDQMQH